MKKITAIILLFNIKLCFSQINIPIDRCIITDTIYENLFAVQCYNDGKNQILKLNDTLFQRTIYYKSNKIKAEIIGNLYEVVDTISIMQPDGNIKFKWVKAIAFKENGPYIEYYNYSGIVKLKGNFINGKISGVWEEWDNNGSLKSISKFDKKGNQIGEYIEYYPSGQIKWKGQYEIVKTNYYHADNKSDLIEMGTKIGIWKHFDEKGILLETVHYNWELY